MHSANGWLLLSLNQMPTSHCRNQVCNQRLSAKFFAREKWQIYCEVEIWGSASSSKPFQPVGCCIHWFRNILSLLRRLQNILWGSKGRSSNYDCESRQFQASADCWVFLSASRRRQLRNYDFKSLALLRQRRSSNYDGTFCQLLTSVDCWNPKSFAASRLRTSSNHGSNEWQLLFQVYCCITFWGSTICSKFWPA